ncbi:GNAT family N-acetyltransferase [Rhodoferax sp. U11-2br]|uniref:GNAT family N-acetyltransferase n=1 Tax=Rhodoferax sp. U11-2br TaxID=2838878 RepID=UPI001BE9A67B|nr:GNAT family N-acetyltransferase [Rhodoferax sp. U11-2br]MBT3068995.1 GNAT family N-acetyltransferase [Rhodoferax sp. U11-2br]
MTIRAASPQDASTLARLISSANRDVATQFGLNVENCPKHPSFCSADWVLADMARGACYFLAEESNGPIACVAFEPAGAGLAYLNRLSVLPTQQRQGVGAQLVQHVLQVASAATCQRVSIGVMGEHQALQRWYSRLGFVATETKHFAHLPFSVTYMHCLVPPPSVTLRNARRACH